MKIFLVEDDTTLNDIITSSLKGIKCKVSAYNDGVEALDNIHSGYDLYLIDINLPNVNGFEILKSIKACKPDANIFIMSGDTDINTILNAYDTGCNDFIKKPFDVREIVAKIQNSIKEIDDVVQLAHNGIYTKSEKTIQFGNKPPIKLTKKEMALLDILIKYRGKNASNEAIEQYVWDKQSDDDKAYVRQLVSKIKTKLPYKDLIENHNSTGYKINLAKEYLDKFEKEDF
jgi:DNA-binding response OmpR family regulator